MANLQCASLSGKGEKQRSSIYYETYISFQKVILVGHWLANYDIPIDFVFLEMDVAFMKLYDKNRCLKLICHNIM